MDGAQTPLSNKNQANDWSDQKITLWWILNVFWPYHLHSEGYVNAMHVMVNCSAHNISDEEKPKLSKQILIFFLPHNVTNTHHLDDMDIISSIKVGYKVTLLEQLLSIFDTE